jgi:hypothetical protein
VEVTSQVWVGPAGLLIKFSGPGPGPHGAGLAGPGPARGQSSCTWNSVLSLIKQPPLLWTVYAPKNLGDYADIKSLWQAWEEGITVEGVGYTPPLQVIDEQWGSCKGRRAVW